MRKHASRSLLLWGVTLFVLLAGAILCLVTGRTLGHALTIWAAGSFLSGAMYLADRYAPSDHGRQVRIATGLISAAAFLVLMLFYAWEMYGARYIYVYDNGQYYYQQLILSKNMPYGLLQVTDLVGRTIAGRDYTYVMNLFVAPLFALTDQTIQSFTLCAAAMTWAPLLYQLRRMMLHLAEQLSLTPRRTIALSAAMCLCVIAFPLTHAAAARGQINLLAMVFFLQIILLSFGDDSWSAPLRHTDWTRRIALFLSVVMLVISRRWYVFLLAGYLLPWAIGTGLSLLRRRAWRGLMHFALYGAACIALGLMLLSSFFRYALQGNYASAYAYWNLGGLPYEAVNQAGYVGLFWLAVMAIGYGWGMTQKRWPFLRALAATMLITFFLTLTLFTRIQNMNHHQAIILVPGYIAGLMLAFTAALTIQRRRIRRITAGLLVTALLGQYGFALTIPSPTQPTARVGLFSNVSLVPPRRPDLEHVAATADFIDANCTPDSKAFFLCDNSWYNAAAYINIRYPDMGLRSKVELGSYAFASHGFPEAYFTSAYLMVPDMCQSERPEGTIERLRAFVFDDFSDRFEAVEVIDHGAFRMHILRRIAPPQADEIDALLRLFAKEDAQYPQRYSGIIEKYRPQAGH